MPEDPKPHFKETSVPVAQPDDLNDLLMDPDYSEDVGMNPQTALRAEIDERTLRKRTGARRWAANHDTFWGATQTFNHLPPGLYRCGFSQSQGPVLERQLIETDNLMELPDEASASIIAEFDQFWTLKESFVSRGFLHKRGFLLWGPPGSGKTSTLQILTKHLIEHNGVVLFLDHPDLAAKCLQMLRAIESTRPVVAIMEDIDALVNKHGENEYLALLDGEAQVDNVVFVATTNYPERLDRRFVDRPSRFDTIKYVGMPTAAARRAYFQAKEPSLKGKELAYWVQESEGLSVAHLKEMIIAVKCFGHKVEDTIARLKGMQADKPNSDDEPDKPQKHVSFIPAKPNGTVEDHEELMGN